MLLAVIGLTVGCSDDSDERNASGSSTSITLVPYAPSYIDAESLAGGTRAENDWIPGGYLPYSQLLGVDAMMKTNEGASIGAFFTKGSEFYVRQFKRRPSGNGKWDIHEEEIANGDYQLYGYVPYSAVPSDKASIAPYGSYAAGATLTLAGLNSVMNQDVCVVVGAKDGNKVAENSYTFDEGRPLKTGDFDCEIKPGTENYLFLLFDHIYSALRFRFRVDTKYAELRTIKLTRLDLMAYSDDDFLLPMPKNMRATVTLQKTSGTSPLVGDIVFTSDGGGDMEKVLIFSGEEDLPSAEGQYTSHLGFVPKAGRYYELYSTYDVYDRQGNTVRKSCVAVNKIDIRSRFNQDLKRGYMYTLNLTVMPTYLYVLSEPDLDNPTVTVN